MSAKEIVESIGEDSGKELDLNWSVRLPSSTLRNITSYEDAFVLATELAKAAGREAPVFAPDLGDGFTPLDKETKNRLVGEAFIMVSANIGHDEVTKRDYVTCRVVTQSGRKYRFSDGSTGIFAQIMDTVTESLGFVPIVCPNGLTVSRYQTQDAEGRPIQAETFYLDVNAL